jgi:hypothetical protein
MTHAYDAPGLTSRQFFEAIQRDKTVPLSLRAEAAHYILRIWGPELPLEPPAYTIRIGTIFPGKQDTIELYRDLLHIKRCWELTVKTGKVVNPDLEAIKPEGHA